MEEHKCGEEPNISSESLHSTDTTTTSTTGVATADPEAEEIVTTPVLKEDSSDHHRHWEIGPFHFHFSLENFRFGRGFTLRRFSIAEAAFLFMVAIIASHGLGVIRQSIFNALFGTGPEANAYIAAYRFPSILFDLIAGGALTHAFIPVFISYEKGSGQKEAWRLASLVFNVLLVTLTAAVLVGEFLAPAFVNNLLVPGYSPSEQALTTALTRIMLIQPLIMGIGTIATAILNSKRQFLLPALSLAIYNVGLIGGLLFSLAIPEVGIYGPTFGTLAAAALQVLVQLPGLLKQGARYSFFWDLKNPGLRQIMKLLIPSTISVAITSGGFIADTAFISYFPDKASLSAQHNAYMLFALPLGLIAQAIAQAALPQLALLAADRRYLQLRRTMLHVILGSLLLAIPAALALWLLGKPTIQIFFQRGAFRSHSANLTYIALLGYAVGLPGQTVLALMIRGFYALKDARTPLLINIVGVATRIGFIVLLLKILKGSSMILAIPLALSGAATLEALLLGGLLFLQLWRKVKMEKSFVPERNSSQPP